MKGSVWRHSAIQPDILTNDMLLILSFKHYASYIYIYLYIYIYIKDRRTATLQNTCFIYLVNKYII